MSLLGIVREQHLLLLLIAQLMISLFLIYYGKNKISYIVEILLTIGWLVYGNTLFTAQIIVCYLLEYMVLKVLLLLIVWLLKHFAFYVLVVITHKKKRLYKFLVKKKRFLRIQVKIWYKVNYGIRIKKGIPEMVRTKNVKTGICFDHNGFPKFKEIVTIKLDKKYWKKSREIHFYHASKILYKKIQRSSTLASKFTKKDIADFKNGKVPSKYTWHHHQNKGVLQLVDYKIHSEVKHRGGFAIWGSCK